MEYYLANDWRVRAASYYESVGYTVAAANLDKRVADSTGAERWYWERVRAALDDRAVA